MRHVGPKPEFHVIACVALKTCRIRPTSQVFMSILLMYNITRTVLTQRGNPAPSLPTIVTD